MADSRTAWTEPGAYHVGEGVYRIPLPLPQDGLRAVNVYAIADGEQVVLIDSGWALTESEELLAKALDGIGYGFGDISEFLVTHVHRDHYTQAVAIRRTHGTRVSLGEGERPGIEAIQQAIAAGRPDPMDHLHRAGAAALLAELSARLQDRPVPTDWEAPDRWLTGGIDLPLQTRMLQVIATPGHTR